MVTSKGKIILLLTILLVVLIIISLFMVNLSPVSPQTGSESDLSNNINLSPTVVNISTQQSFDNGSIDQPALTFQIELETQTKSDIEYAQMYESMHDDFPWLDLLPLQTDTYFVYFDVNQEAFFGEIYVSENQEEIKNEITARLSELQIPYENYRFVWE